MMINTAKMIQVWMYDERNVACRPPEAVYIMMPHGIKNEASRKSIPVRASTVAAPPSKSIAVTIILALKQKKRKVLCAVRPHRALTISATVCAVGATFLSLIASTPNKRT